MSKLDATCQPFLSISCLPTITRTDTSWECGKENKKEKNVCSRPCYHHNYELCLQSDIWVRVKCNSFCCTPFCSSSLAPLVPTIVITCIVMWRSEWGCDRIELVKSLHYTGTCIAATMHAYIPSTPLDITEFYFVGQLSRGKGNFAALTKTSNLLAQII